MNIIHTNSNIDPKQLTFINDPNNFPGLLKHIEDPPSSLNYKGTLPANKNTLYICFVGSRKASEYGKNVIVKLMAELTPYSKYLPICIVSGLAYGIDAFSHEQALKKGFYCLAVPGSGLDDYVLYPKEHLSLSYKILQSGGALLSEFDSNFIATPWSFPQRNRIMAGISHITIIIEGAINSGSLITAKLALDYNRIVCVVPGSIFYKGSEASLLLLKEGAHPISSGSDIVELLSLSYPSFYDQAVRSKLINEKNISEKVERISKNKIDVSEIFSLDEQIVNMLKVSMTLNEITKNVHQINALNNLELITDLEILRKISMLEIEGKIEQKNGLYRQK